MSEQDFNNYNVLCEQNKKHKREIEKLKLENILTRPISELYFEKIDYIKQTIYDLRIATRDGNFTDPAGWSVSEIVDFIDLKKKQIEREKQNLKNVPRGTF